MSAPGPQPRLGPCTAAWCTEQRRVNDNESSAALTAWKKDPDLAFLDFFDQRARSPRFKSRKKSEAAAEYTRSGFKYRNGQITLAKMAGGRRHPPAELVSDLNGGPPGRGSR